MEDVAMEDGGNRDVPGPVTAIDPTVNTTALINELLRDKELQQKTIAGLQLTIKELLHEVTELRKTFTSQNTSHPNNSLPEPLQAPKAKRPKTGPKPTPPTPIPTKNSFQILTPTDNTANKPTSFPPLPSKLPPKTITISALPSISPPTQQTIPNPTASKPNEIPPIILHNKDLWTQVSSKLLTNKISYTRATNTREGIRVILPSIENYRALQSFLTKENFSFHSYQLPSEKTIKVVLRGVPLSLTNQQILDDLKVQNYSALRITRLNGRNNHPAPLIMLQMETKFKSIYNLKTICGLDITVEAKKIPSGPLQCHRCQRFGHTQPNCHAPYRCLKCAESHSTHLCPKPTTTPATCANCAESHISSYHSCPKNPQNLTKTSYSNALNPSPAPKNHSTNHTPKTVSPSQQNFASLTFPIFEALLATNPTPEKIQNFATQISLLKQTIYG